MDLRLKDHLTSIARQRIPNTDVSHDIQHTLRVLKNAELLANAEGGDMDVVVPAALFHDLVVYPKDHPEKHLSQIQSAEAARAILETLVNHNFNYPHKKIKGVETCILECSFTNNVKHSTLESKILQDADGLEATWAISIARTFSSAGQMAKIFYDPQDPFCKNRKPDGKKYAFDLFYERLLVVESRMYTETAKAMAKTRHEFLKLFLEQLKSEIC